jgi:Sulfatase
MPGEDYRTKALSEPGGWWQDISIAWFPFLVAFVLIPFSVYLPNQAEYDYNLIYVIPFLFSALVSLALLLSLRLLKPNAREFVALVLFLAGVCLAISDAMIPVQMPVLDGTKVLAEPAEPSGLTAIEIVLALLVLACGIAIPRRLIIRYGSLLVPALLLVEVAVVLVDLSPMSTVSRPASAGLRVSETPEIAKNTVNKPNIYQIVFDGYSSCAFLESVKECEYEHAFEGFTFFKNNRANYPHTLDSFTSYMTGTLFDGNSPNGRHDQALTSGLIKKLHDSGYGVTQYLLDRSQAHKAGASVFTNNDLVSQLAPGAQMSGFFGIWLMRMAPNFLQGEAQAIASGPIRKLFRWIGSSLYNDYTSPLSGVQFSLDPRISVRMMERLIAEEADRPSRGQYVYAHLCLPHPPYTVDRTCADTERHFNYMESACCATKLMAEFIQTLKRLGRFEDSLIVFHADHGWDRQNCEAHPNKSMISAGPDDSKWQALDSDAMRRLMELIVSRSRALLLVKRPRALPEPLRVSTTPTQLIDVAPTILAAAGINAGGYQGIPVFRQDPSRKRVCRFFFRPTVPSSKPGRMDLPKTDRFIDLSHASFTPGEGWKLHPAVRVKR